MNETSREFHIGDLITVVDGHLVSPDHMDGIYNVVDFVTGQAHMTHQLPRASREITPWLLEQYVGREAIAELVEMVGRDRVVPVVIEGE